MSLTSCPECGREVSSSVAACPHCGYVMNAPAGPRQEAPAVAPVAEGRVVDKKRSGSVVNIIIGVVALVVLIGAALWYLGVLPFV